MDRCEDILKSIKDCFEDVLDDTEEFEARITIFAITYFKILKEKCGNALLDLDMDDTEYYYRIRDIIREYVKSGLAISE